MGYKKNVEVQFVLSLSAERDILFADKAR